jgi:hypothetical protein
MTPVERKLIERLCAAIENFDPGLLHVSGIDEVWGELGRLGSEVHDLTEELKRHG